MCVTFFCLHPKTGKTNNVEFLIGFNRDQQTRRDTDPLGPFSEDPNIFAGRDKISGGTWLGVNVKTGIIVILTNYDLQQERFGKSRGKLVLSFLHSQAFESLPLEQYDQVINQRICQVLKQRKNYSAFNLLVYSIQTSKIFYICSEMELNEPKILQQGRPYGMCNGPLDELWQKTKHGLNIFEKVIDDLDSVKSPQKYFLKETFDLLKDNVSFDPNVQKEASIFINPYYSTAEKTQRMTKCSFCCIVKKYQMKGFEIEMKEITYTSPNLKQSIVEYRKKIGIQNVEK